MTLERVRAVERVGKASMPGPGVVPLAGGAIPAARSGAMRPVVRRLAHAPLNPIPQGAEVRTAVAADGVRLRVASWPAPRGARRGTLVLLQGRGDLIEKYFETVEDLRARGFAVETFDWRGQGGSQRLLPDPRLSHIDDFASYGRDLAAVLGPVRARAEGPVVALGHSMGGAVLLDALRRQPGLVDAACVTAPMVALSPALKPPGAEWLCAALARAGLRPAAIPGRARQALVSSAFPRDNLLTSDPVRFDRWNAALQAAPEFGLGKPTIGWLEAAFRIMAGLRRPEAARAVTTPLLVAAGDADRVTSTPAAERFAIAAPRGVFVGITGARHEVLMERDALRDAFLGAFDRFIDDALPRRSQGIRAAAG